MTTTQLTPTPVFKAYDNNGLPLFAGKLFTYIAGTTTKQATYVDSIGITQNTNPVILNFRGEANVWLDPTKIYKLVLAPSTDTDPPTNPIWTIDNIQGLIATQQQIGLVLYPQSAAELAAGVTPTNYWYPPGNVLRYGADPTNTSDSTVAFANAIAPMPSGGQVTVPAGTYKVSSLTVTAGVVLQGVGLGGTTIMCTSATATLLTMRSGSGVYDMQLSASVVKTAGYHIDVEGNGVLIQRVQPINYYIAINIGVLGGLLAVNTQIRHCVFFNPVVALGGGGILGSNVSNLVVDSCVMSGPALPATQPDFGICLLNGDTALISNNNITLHGKALQMNTPAANNFFAASFVNCLFDSAGTNSGGAASSAILQPAGNVKNTKFSNCWFGLSQANFGCEVAPSGAGTVDGLSFAGCEFIKNGQSGIILNGTGVKNVSISGGGAGGNTNYGYRLSGGCTYITITGVSAGNYSNRGPNAYGINVDNASACDYYLIADNNVQGNTTAGIFDGGTGTHAQVKNNAGYNGLANALGAAIGASPATLTAGHTPEEHWLFAGTVSNVTLDGTTIANATGAHVHLEPNESYIITYTVLPTVTKKLV